MQSASQDQIITSLAAQLHATLSQLLSQQPANDQTASALLSELRSLISAHQQLQRCVNNSKAADAADEDLAATCSRRAGLLDDALQLLDDSVFTLRSQLDKCHQLLKIAPCMSNPDTIMQYSHTLRYGFQPLGIVEGQPSAPPAPQVYHFIPSMLKRYHEAKAQQQSATRPQQAAPDVTQQQQQPQQPDMQQQQQQQAEMQQQQRAIQQQQRTLPGIVPFALNEDLSDETADEELSDSDDDFSDD